METDENAKRQKMNYRVPVYNKLQGTHKFVLSVPREITRDELRKMVLDKTKHDGKKIYVAFSINDLSYTELNTLMKTDSTFIVVPKPHVSA
mgnify:FL=1